MPKKIPMRMCLGCREMKPKKELIRIVRTPESDVVIDLVGKKSGRGAYICPQEVCLARAIKQKQVDRALEVTVDATLYESLRQQVLAGGTSGG